MLYIKTEKYVDEQRKKCYTLLVKKYSKGDFYVRTLQMEYNKKKKGKDR